MGAPILLVCVLLAVALPAPARAEIEHFIVTGSGFVSVPIIGPVVDLSVEGTASFDTESGALKLDMNQGTRGSFAGEMRLDVTVTITPESVSGRDIVVAESGVDFVQNTCRARGWMSCSPPEVQLGVHRPWFLWGSAKGVRMSFLGETRDVAGSGTRMPLRIEDGSVLRIVWSQCIDPSWPGECSDSSIEVIDYYLTAALQP